MPDATLLLTRPLPASLRFHEELKAAGVSCPAVISPLIRIEPLPVGDLSADVGLIFTSENGVRASGAVAGRAWVVGSRTAQAAREAGLTVKHVAPDADALVAYLLANRPDCPLLHLRGEHARGEIAKRVDAGEQVVYRQHEMRLSDEALALLAGGGTVIVPLFSPRTAMLLAAQSGIPDAPCRIVAFKFCSGESLALPCYKANRL